MNYPVNRTDIKLFRNVKNEVEFYIKDIDRKPVAIGDKTPIIHIIDRRTQRVVISRELTVVDAAKARYLLTMQVNDLKTWVPGFYTYSVTLQDTDGTESLLYTDRDREATAVIEVLDGHLPDPVASTEVPSSAFTILDGWQRSGSFAGAAQVGNTSGLHTLVAYVTGFVGEIMVQATLDDQPAPDDSQWFDAASIVQETPADGLLNLTFEGNYMWVRFKVKTTEGTFTKLLYRN